MPCTIKMQGTSPKPIQDGHQPAQENKTFSYVANENQLLSYTASYKRIAKTNENVASPE